MRKLTALLLLLLTAAMPVACRHNVNSSNPRVIFAVTILDASTAVDDLSLTLRAANDGVNQLAATEPEYYAKVHPWLVRIAQANNRAVAVLRAAKAGDTSADWRAALAAIATEAAGTDPTVFGFKNPTSQASVRLIFASLTATLAAINKSFATKSGGA